MEVAFPLPDGDLRKSHPELAFPVVASDAVTHVVRSKIKVKAVYPAISVDVKARLTDPHTGSDVACKIIHAKLV